MKASQHARRWSTLGLLTAVVATLVPFSLAVDVRPAGAVTVTAGTDAELRTALLDTSVTLIDLTANINMVCGSGTFGRQVGGTGLTIDGHGFTISGATCNTQVMNFSGSEALTLKNVTFTGGNHTLSSSVGGGGLQANGDLTLDGVTFTGNTITSTGTVATAGGGGIYAGGLNKTVTITNSTITNNVATCGACIRASGAGIEIGNTDTALILRNSTVTGNTASGSGSSRVGGGIYVPDTGSSLTLVYSTVVGNTATTGANIASLNLASFASVVALPTGGANCDITNAPASNGYNFDSGTSCGLATGTDQTNGGDPLLGALASNGGPTQTRMPATTSPLIEKIPVTSCSADGASAIAPLVDQRGFPRPKGGGCDIGAVELPAGTFRPLVPQRILDTRFGNSPQCPTCQNIVGALAPNEIRKIAVNLGGVPNPGASAVLLNVTVTAPSKAGWLTVFPADAATPAASNLNFVAGQTVPNLVLVKVGKGGVNEAKVSIGNTVFPTGPPAAAGTVHVIADVAGYYTDATQTPEDGFTSIDPIRIMDTRFGNGPQCPTCLDIVGAFGPNEERDVAAGGFGVVPSDADAVVMNVTVTGPSAGGWLTLYPTGGALPNAANLNFVAGQTIANLVTVKTGTGSDLGKVTVANTAFPTGPPPASGTVHVIADVVGYYKAGVGKTLSTIVPVRILDTRFGIGGVTGPVAPQATILANPQTASGLPAAGGYTSVVVNLAVTSPTAAGWLTAFPSTLANPPNAANLNFLAGKTVPNLVKVGVGADGKFKISNTKGCACAAAPSRSSPISSATSRRAPVAAAPVPALGAEPAHLVEDDVGGAGPRVGT